MPLIQLGLGEFDDYENNRDIVFIIVMLMSTFPQLSLCNIIKICTLVVYFLV